MSEDALDSILALLNIIDGNTSASPTILHVHGGNHMSSNCNQPISATSPEADGAANSVPGTIRIETTEEIQSNDSEEEEEEEDTEFEQEWRLFWSMVETIQDHARKLQQCEPSISNREYFRLARITMASIVTFWRHVVNNHYTNDQRRSLDSNGYSLSYHLPFLNLSPCDGDDDEEEEEEGEDEDEDGSDESDESDDDEDPEECVNVLLYHFDRVLVSVIRFASELRHLDDEFTTADLMRHSKDTWSSCNRFVSYLELGADHEGDDDDEDEDANEDDNDNDNDDNDNNDDVRFDDILLLIAAINDDDNDAQLDDVLLLIAVVNEIRRRAAMAPPQATAEEVVDMIQD